MSASIIAQDLCLTFPDSTEVLRKCSFAVEKGEFVSLVGPSGCGKSTVLRLISGLLDPTHGSCASGSNRIEFVFQDAALLPWRSAVGNVELLLELTDHYRHDRPARRRLAIAALQSMSLHDSINKLPRQLSGGMKMRVSLARSLVTNPDIYLFDEPFASLDEFTRESLNDDLQLQYVNNKFSAVFVTHSIAEAVYMSNRVLVMSPRPGSIIADIDVPFSFPRSPDLRYSADFAACCGRVAAHLRTSAN